MSTKPRSSRSDSSSPAIVKPTNTKKSSRARHSEAKSDASVPSDVSRDTPSASSRRSRDDPLRAPPSANGSSNNTSVSRGLVPPTLMDWTSLSTSPEAGVVCGLLNPQPPSGSPTTVRSRAEPSPASSILVMNGGSSLTGPKGANATMRPGRASRLDGAVLEAAVHFDSDSPAALPSASDAGSPTHSSSSPRCGSGHRRRMDSTLTTHSSMLSNPSAPPLLAPHRSSLRLHLSRRALIGKGSFGIVYKAMDTDTNELLAVKEISLGGLSFPPASAATPSGGGAAASSPSAATPSAQSTEKQRRIAVVQKELAVLRQLNHPNIIQYLGDEFEDDCLRIYMEYMPGGSVSTLIKTFGTLQERQASAFTRQVLHGLAYLHGKNIIHRDLKGDNLLVDTHGRLKLADFGTARDLTNTVATTNSAIAGTAYFTAPEVVQNAPVNSKADIWSTACCVIEMLTGAPPLSHISNQFSMLMLLAKSDETLSDSYIPKDNEWSASALDFLHQCLQRDPAKRPSAQELLRHGWIVQPPNSDFVRSVQDDVLAVTVTSVALPEPIAPPGLHSSQDSILDMTDIAPGTPIDLQSTPDDDRPTANTARTTPVTASRKEADRLAKKEKKRRKSEKAARIKEKEKRRRAKSVGASPQSPAPMKAVEAAPLSTDAINSPFAHTTSQLQLGRDGPQNRTTETDTTSTGFLPPLSPGSHPGTCTDLELPRASSRPSEASATPAPPAPPSGRWSPFLSTSARRDNTAPKKHT